MRTYHKTTIIIGGVFSHDIETWTEHNHSTVYSMGNEIFDGYKCEAKIVKDNEIKRVFKQAEEMGLTAQINEK